MTKEESIQFHIRSNEYFGTLASEIDLLAKTPSAAATPETTTPHPDELVYSSNFSHYAPVA